MVTVQGMIKRSQIVTASEIARELNEVYTRLRALEDKAFRDGLVEDSEAIRAAATKTSEAAIRLEGEARRAFVAARRGRV